MADDLTQITYYGYPDDPTPDSKSREGIGDHDNKLTPDVSVALTAAERMARFGVSGHSTGKEFTVAGKTLRDDDTAPEGDRRIDIYSPTINNRVALSLSGKIKSGAITAQQGQWTGGGGVADSGPDVLSKGYLLGQLRDKYSAYKDASDDDLWSKFSQKFDTPAKQLKAIYPQYSNVGDDKLGALIRSKFYPSENSDDFNERFNPPSGFAGVTQHYLSQIWPNIQKNFHEAVGNIAQFPKNLDDASQAPMFKWMESVDEFMDKHTPKIPGIAADDPDYLRKKMKRWYDAGTQQQAQAAQVQVPKPVGVAGQLGKVTGEAVGSTPEAVMSFLPGLKPAQMLIWGMMYEGIQTGAKAQERGDQNGLAESWTAAGARGLQQYLLNSPRGRLLTGLYGAALGMGNEQAQKFMAGDKNNSLDQTAAQGAVDFFLMAIMGRGKDKLSSKAAFDEVTKAQEAREAGETDKALEHVNRAQLFLTNGEKEEIGQKLLTWSNEVIPAPRSQEPTAPAEHVWDPDKARIDAELLRRKERAKSKLARLEHGASEEEWQGMIKQAEGQDVNSLLAESVARIQRKSVIGDPTIRPEAAARIREKAQALKDKTMPKAEYDRATDSFYFGNKKAPPSADPEERLPRGYSWQTDENGVTWTVSPEGTKVVGKQIPFGDYKAETAKIPMEGTPEKGNRGELGASINPGEILQKAWEGYAKMRDWIHETEKSGKELSTSWLKFWEPEKVSEQARTAGAIVGEENARFAVARQRQLNEWTHGMDLEDDMIFAREAGKRRSFGMRFTQNQLKGFLQQHLNKQSTGNHIMDRLLSIYDKGYEAIAKFDKDNNLKYNIPEPKSWNPEDMFQQRLDAGLRARMKASAYRSMAEGGVAIPKEDLEKMAPEMQESIRDQSTQVTAPDGRQYFVHRDAQALTERSWQPSKLPEGAGVILNGLQNLKQNTIAIRLGWSAFHQMHMLPISAADTMARALESVVGGDFKLSDMPRIMKELGQSQSVALTGKGFKEGDRLLSWYKGEGSLHDLSEGERSRLYYQRLGGFVPLMSHERELQFVNMITTMVPAAKQAADATLGIGYKIITGEPYQKMVFSHIIPALKMISYDTQAMALLHSKPELKGNKVELRNKLHEISRIVDSRYGEQFYDNIFWPKWIKQVGMQYFLSLSWQLSFWRVHMGAAVSLLDSAAHMGEIIKQAKTEGIRPAAQRVLTKSVMYAPILAAVTAGTNGLISYFLGGSADKPMDYLYPKINNLANMWGAWGPQQKGKDVRVKPPFWITTEFGGAYHDIKQYGPILGMIHFYQGKATPIQATLAALVENKDYVGKEIYNSMADPKSQMMQAMGYVLSQMAPISVENASDIRHKPVEAIAGMMGLPKAPSWTGRTDTENEMVDRYYKFYAPAGKEYNAKERMEASQQLREALQSKDEAGANTAREKMAKLGMSHKQINAVGNTHQLPGQAWIFKHFKEEDQEYFLKKMGKEERMEYEKYAKPQARHAVEIGQ